MEINRTILIQSTGASQMLLLMDNNSSDSNASTFSLDLEWNILGHELVTIQDINQASLLPTLTSRLQQAFLDVADVTMTTWQWPNGTWSMYIQYQNYFGPLPTITGGGDVDFDITSGKEANILLQMTTKTPPVIPSIPIGN